MNYEHRPLYRISAKSAISKAEIPVPPDKKLDKIEHTDELLKDFGEVFLNKEFSDVTLTVESKTFHCHKVILASRSEYFKALLYGNMKEAGESEIELKEVSSEAFQLLLIYIYTSKMDLAKINVELILDVFHLADQFRFESLVKSLSSYLTSIVNHSNVCVIFEKALLYEQAALIDVCSKHIDNFANKIINDELYMKLSMPALAKILQRDSFIVDEINIFRAVHKWIKHNERQNGDKYEDILQVVRLPLINSEDLLKVVRPSKLFSETAILDALTTQSSPKFGEIKHRDKKVSSSIYQSPTMPIYMPYIDEISREYFELND